MFVLDLMNKTNDINKQNNTKQDNDSPRSVGILMHVIFNLSEWTINWFIKCALGGTKESQNNVISMRWNVTNAHKSNYLQDYADTSSAILNLVIKTFA